MRVACENFAILQYTYFKIERKSERKKERVRDLCDSPESRAKDAKVGTLNTLRTTILIKMRISYILNAK